MWNKALLIICASSVIHVTPSDSACQDTSGPYSYNFEITCINDTNLLPKFAKEVSVLKCLNCNIPILDNTTVLINFRGETFNMSNSRVRKIRKSAFNTFTNQTRKFLFANNEIDYIEPKVFNNFSTIDLIDLQNCQIDSLERGVFEGTRLARLDLSLNHLSNINFVFDGLKVNKLDLSSNRIKELSEDTFEKMTFWEGPNWRNQLLDLSNNLIEKLVPNTFKTSNQTNKILDLYIGKNSISVIEDYTFSNLIYLETLSIEDNKISTLNKDSFKALIWLQNLILSKNLISNLPFGLFKDLGKLQTLDLSNNRLSVLTPNTFSGLIDLIGLNVSNNDLKILEPSHLIALGKLVSLDVSATKLHNLKVQEIIDHHFRLRTFVINDNFWTCKHLMEMYQLLNDKLQGFNYPARHYNVPNLHGIACSRGQLESYDNLSFEDFLNTIAGDRVVEDITNSPINDAVNETNSYADAPYSDINGIINKIKIIYCMFIILTVIAIILFIHYVIKCVIEFLRDRNIIGDDFILFYTQKEDNVNIIP